MTLGDVHFNAVGSYGSCFYKLLKAFRRLKTSVKLKSLPFTGLKAYPLPMALLKGVPTCEMSPEGSHVLPLPG